MNDVLALVDDPALTASLHRVAAATDRTVGGAATPPPRRTWLDAGLVVVDRSAALLCAQQLPRRGGIVLVTAGGADLPDWQAATAVGAEHVVGLPDDEVELLTVLGTAAEPDTGGGHVVAVLGGCGGAGASTFAAALAWTVAAFRRSAGALLVDGDPLGGGLDVLTGIEERPGVRWSGLAVDRGRLSARSLRDAVPEWLPGLGVLSADRESTSEPAPAAVTAVLDTVRRSGDVVVCDVPRSRGPAAEAMVAAADLAVLVVPARVRAALAAGRVAGWVADQNTNQGIVVRGPAPGGLRGRDVAEVVGLPLLATMRAQPGLAETLERGGLRLGRRSPLVHAAESVLDVLAGPEPGSRWAA
ncbi:hypothetical protein G352_05829 [Rhodococcus ruber BKS 20-38]|uniref:Rv3660c-like CheY-like N-terminal domain-containing protein n=1 Tax=Rhodococcus ruber BKS 20-38 TaxID=1278076 RepID=M2XZ71_9NOCA|nr:septum site-determining protein Ssd [Rhodococcus ruber]EME66171.1 hypothetical protein G352_05829 [Rhodococcus ruber BKS 20-38]